MTTEKAPWINPDLTFKGAVAGIGALLVVLLLGVLAIGIVGLFAWYFVMELIYNPTVHVLFGIVVVLGIVGFIHKQVTS